MNTWRNQNPIFLKCANANKFMFQMSFCTYHSSMIDWQIILWIELLPPFLAKPKKSDQMQSFILWAQITLHSPKYQIFSHLHHAAHTCNCKTDCKETGKEEKNPENKDVFLPSKYSLTAASGIISSLLHSQTILM